MLDDFLAEMNRRFSDESTIMTAIQACTPGSDTFFDLEAIKHFCQFYDIDMLYKVKLKWLESILVPKLSKGVL